MAVVLWEAAVTEHALLLLHGAADDDPDREDEDRQGHTQRWVVILELAATVRTVGAAMIMMGNVRKTQNRIVGDAVNYCCNNLNVWVIWLMLIKQNPWMLKPNSEQRRFSNMKLFILWSFRNKNIAVILNKFSYK